MSDIPGVALHAQEEVLDKRDKREEARKPNANAATGASAASVRAISTQFMAFYFRAPAKAFFRTRVE
jgi:hypothetical protein